MSFYFHCNACGKCCNSPPAMTVEELFHHQDRFIGCLTVRIVERPSAATRIPGTGEPLHPDDLAEWQELVDATSFELPGALPPHLRIQLGTQGYEHPIFGNRCPALAADSRCEIHDDRKPAMCRAVPLEPALPDGLQRVVLRRRMEEAGWMGAACIARGKPPASNYGVMVKGRRVMQNEDRVALAVRRKHMHAETRVWGSKVFKLLASELISTVRHGLLLPNGHLAMSMTPVLQVIAKTSTTQSQRCDSYAEQQSALIRSIAARAVGKGEKSHRASTASIRRFEAHYLSYLS